MSKNLLITQQLEQSITSIGDLIFGLQNNFNLSAGKIIGQLITTRKDMEGAVGEIRELRNRLSETKDAYLRTKEAHEAALERISELEAARHAYASEFEPGPDGDPDVGSIHQNIRNLKKIAGT